MNWSAALETGAVVELVHTATGLKLRALVEKKGDGEDRLPTISLCSLERPYEKLRVALNGQVDWSVAAAKFASLQLELASDSEATALHTAQLGDSIAAASSVYVYLKPVVHQKKPNRDGATGWYLGAIAGSPPQLIGDASRSDGSVFHLSIVSKRGAFTLDTSRTVLHGAFRRRRLLSDSQRHAFMRDGFLHLRDVVPITLVNAAKRCINHELGVPGRIVDGGVEGTGKLAGSVSNAAELLDLFFLSDAHAYAEALVGEGNVAPPRGVQIALRFPELGEPRDPIGTEWHTDGMRQGKRHPFTLLVGIALSDAREPLAGNLTVFPGSHRTLHPLVRDDGKLQGVQDECYRAGSVWGDGTLPDLGVPVPLLASRGDLVLAHPNLAHRGGLNFSPDIRYQVYYRLKHVHHEALQAQSTHDLWIDLEGLHDLI